MDKEPHVSIIVPTHNRNSIVGACIESLFALSYPADRYEVIIVNDGSTDDTEKTLSAYREKAPCAYRWFTQKNSGISAARNAGIRRAKGEVICFTDDDCVANKNWITELLRGFNKESVGGVGGCVKSVRTGSVYERYSEEAGLLSQKKFRSMNYLVGCNAAYRKSVLDKVGGFDTFLNACEDMDLAIQTQFRGYTLVYAHDAIVCHQHRATLKGLFSQQYRNGMGYMRLHKKYVKDFNPGYNIIIISYRSLRALIKYPFAFFKALPSKDRRYLLEKPLLDLTVMQANLLGILWELLSGREFPGVKVKEKIQFIEDQSINALLLKLQSRMKSSK